MSRKTVNVSDVLKKANMLLSLPDSANINAGFRSGVSTMIENILMESGNYAGFGFPEWLDGGYALWIEAGQPEDKTPYFGDESRRRYFTHSNLNG